MLTQEDLKQIGGLLSENNKVLKTELKAELKAELVPEIVAQVGEMLEQNILPQLDEFRTDMKAGFDAVDRRFDRVEGKTNALINVLREKNVINEVDKQRVLS